MQYSTDGRMTRINRSDREQEQAVAKKFYADYRYVWQTLVAHVQNQTTAYGAPVMFETIQKLLNRLLVVCFCEDNHLLSNNRLRHLVQAAKQSSDDSGTGIWCRLKELFFSMNQDNFNRLNGELFQVDPVLDQIIIQDHMFCLVENITRYDFSTDVSVNILGYVFEQSMNDLEKIKSDMTEAPGQGRRKKEGIFYTSPDVTKRLLDETLQRWMDDRKRELQAVSRSHLYDQLQKQLQSVTILDPAAGSGAFLNMALDSVVSEWETIHKKRQETQDGQVNITDISRYIVNHNLFGVDRNDESIEIAKWSLWLKTATTYDELTSLDAHLQTGNSIIDQPDVSDEAFDWHQAFPDVMNAGGFDIIIGNPPYVFTRDNGFSDDEKAYFNSHYDLVDYQMNTYLLFIERSYHLLKEGGWFAFIVPNTCLTIDSCKKMRRFLLEQTGHLKIINIYDRMFEQAGVDTCFIIFQKRTPTTVKLGEFTDGHVTIVADVEPDELTDEQSIINISLMKNKQAVELMKKIENTSLDLGSVATVKSGLVAYEVGEGIPVQTKEMKENRVYHSDYQVDDTYWRYLDGRDVCRYHLNWGGKWLQYGANLAAKRQKELFTKPRILVRQIPSQAMYAIHAVYTEKALLNDRNANNIIDCRMDPLFLLGVINSTVMTFWFMNKFDKFQRKTFPQLKVKDLKMFPVPDVSEQKQKRISQFVEQMLHVQRDKNTDEWNEEEARLNKQIDQWIADAFGLSEEEIKRMEANLAESVN
ncbi:hypothetical protein GCM10008983_18770 [Lentibacillus halophilus]|uniref:site-specific DNA-methyltransferase (adenine-specific) n=1 Tax=Lentibacillus halophilus TaxID=295065 RepID=A0ABP3J4R9_9BACI